MYTNLRTLLALTLLGVVVTSSAAVQDDADRARRRTPVVAVFESARDAVVNISSTEVVTVRRWGVESLFEDFFDFPTAPRTQQLRRQSVGSGFVIHPGGYIVTNAHVVAGTIERKVTFANGDEYDAQVVAIDTDRDLAVLKIDNAGSLPTLPLGRSDDLMVGETVIAIGNPLGYQHTVTAGVVSAIGRDLQLSREMELSELIQTDASINPGNSGGPLLNVLGELIGINTAIRGDAQNIGFAIPVDQLRRVLPDLLDVERRYRVVSGLSVGTLDEPRVLAVEEGSPADKAGVRVGDLVRSVDGRPVREGIDYYISLVGRQPAETLSLTLERGEREIEARYRLAARPTPDGRALAEARLGVDVYPLPEEIALDLQLPQQAGLLVVDVEPGGPADVLGMRQRDVLVAIGRHYVSTVDELGQILETIEPRTRLPITILRVDRRGKMRLTGQLLTR